MLWRLNSYCFQNLNQVKEMETWVIVVSDPSFSYYALGLGKAVEGSIYPWEPCVQTDLQVEKS